MGKTQQESATRSQHVLTYHTQMIISLSFLFLGFLSPGPSESLRVWVAASE
jgi:hypothetical protein